MSDLYLRVQSASQGLLLEEDANGLTFRKELIYANAPGEKFVKKTEDKEQEFTVDENRLRHWEHTGNMMLQNGVKVPTPLKHTDAPEANRGTIKRFERGINDNGRQALFGIVEFRDAEAAKLAASTDVSIFVPDKPIYDGFGNKYDQPIRHVCFTDYPVIPGLSGFEAIAASLECGVSDIASAAVGHVAKYIRKNPVLTAASLVGKGAILHRGKQEGIQKTDTTATKAKKLGAGALVGGAGAYVAGHGIHSIYHTLKHLKTANPVHAAIATAWGLSSAFLGKHAIHKGVEIVRGEHGVHASLELARHSLKGSGGRFVSAKAPVDAFNDRLAKVLKAHNTPAGKRANAKLREMATASAISRHATRRNFAAATAAIIAGTVIAHHLFGEKKKETALSLNHEATHWMFKKHKRSRAFHAVGAAINAGLATIGAIQTAGATASAVAALHMHKAAGNKSKLLIAKNLIAPVIGAALTAYSARKAAKHAHAAIYGDKTVEASLQLNTDEDGYVRQAKGRFGVDPNSKRQQRIRRRSLVAKSEHSKAIAGVGTEHNSKQSIPSYKSAVAHAKEHIHDFYTADKHELNKGSNLLHAAKHSALGAAHGGVAVLAALGAGKSAYRGIMKGKWHELAKFAATAGASGAATEGASSHFEAAGQHLKAFVSHKKRALHGITRT